MRQTFITPTHVTSPSRRDHTSTQCEGPVLLLLKREAKMISPYLILATVVHDRTLSSRRDSDWIGAPVRFYNKKREGKGRVGLWWKRWKGFRMIFTPLMEGDRGCAEFSSRLSVSPFVIYAESEIWLS